jgi:hypothetical protein
MKTTLEYLKDRYIEEQSRFDHFENKCAKLLTLTSLVIGIVTAASGLNKGAIFHPQTATSCKLFTGSYCHCLRVGPRFTGTAHW